MVLLPQIGCREEEHAAVDGPSDSGNTIWYGWEDEKIFSSSQPPPDTGKDWLVWTDQTRGVGIIYYDGNAYVAVNGLGIAIFHDIFTSATPLEVTEIYEKRLFSERTIGNFFFYENRFYNHLYYNTVFHTEEAPKPPVSLVSFQPDSREMRVLPFSFQDENNDWELVSLYPFGEEQTWQLAWKRTGSEEISFRYTLLDIETWKESEIDKDTFFQFLSPALEVNAPLEVQRLIRVYDGNKGKSVFDVAVSRYNKAARETYRFGNFAEVENGETELVRLKCFYYENTYFLLVPGGELLWLDKEGNKGKYRLPILPKGFVYTDFISDGDTVLALWEEQDFTKVRRAGLVYSSLRDRAKNGVM